jgi:hypothetical protein
MEKTYELLDAIIAVSIEANTSGELPPSVLNHIGEFTQYLPGLGSFHSDTDF